MSSYGPPKNYRGALEVDLKTCAKGTKLRVYNECHFVAQEPSFGSCETHCEVKKADFATKVPFRRGFRDCEAHIGTRVPFRSIVTLISQLRNGCEVPKREKSQFRSQSSIWQGISQLRNQLLAHECHFAA